MFSVSFMKFEGKLQEEMSRTDGQTDISCLKRCLPQLKILVNRWWLGISQKLKCSGCSTHVPCPTYTEMIVKLPLYIFRYIGNRQKLPTEQMLLEKVKWRKIWRMTSPLISPGKIRSTMSLWSLRWLSAVNACQTNWMVFPVTVEISTCFHKMLQKCNV